MHRDGSNSLWCKRFRDGCVSAYRTHRKGTPLLPYEMSWENEENTLVVRGRAGDREAFAEIYARHERVVFRYAYRMLGHREDAHDVRQETFLKAFGAIARFRGECCLQTWLLKICANLCRNHLRARLARPGSAFDPESEAELLRDDRDNTDPYLVAARSQETEMVRMALRSLPPAQRELILLREYEELPCEEIAQILGCSVVTVRVKLFRARSRLKDRLDSLLKER